MNPPTAATRSAPPTPPPTPPPIAAALLLLPEDDVEAASEADEVEEVVAIETAFEEVGVAALGDEAVEEDDGVALGLGYVPV